MSARILVAGNTRASAKPIEARLSAAYFDVLVALSGAETLGICGLGRCDIVLIEPTMPDMDGFSVCRGLKSNEATQHVPVVMVTAPDQPSDLVRGLEAGADEILAQPVSDAALVARVRSLVRLRMMTDELRMRALTSREIGIESPAAELTAETGHDRHVLLVEDRTDSSDRIATMLGREHRVDVELNGNKALFRAAQGNYDLDGLKICSQLRSFERTRHVQILATVGLDENPKRLARSLEIGVNDFIFHPVDVNELMARARMHVRKGRDAGDDVLREFAGRLRKSIRGIDLACRSGGEDFVVLMPDANRAVAQAAERLRRRIASEPFQIEAAHQPVEVTVSVGISGLTGPDDTPAKLLKRADEALYRAQRDGRNRVVADAA